MIHTRPPWPTPAELRDTAELHTRADRVAVEFRRVLAAAVKA
jgi:hypothetical protein